jgi:hypothetical protein
MPMGFAESECVEQAGHLQSDKTVIFNVRLVRGNGWTCGQAACRTLVCTPLLECLHIYAV